jgi:hypothetical protein
MKELTDGQWEGITQALRDANVPLAPQTIRDAVGIIERVAVDRAHRQTVLLVSELLRHLRFAGVYLGSERSAVQRAEAWLAARSIDYEAELGR